MKILLIIFIVLFVILLVLVVFSVGLLRFVTLPKNRVPVDKAPEIEKSKDLWGPYDSYEKVEMNFTMDDGYLIHGTYIPSGDDNKFVIITHGYTYNRLGGVKYLNIFHELGYNAYIYDIRHHGDNADCYCSMGYKESRDIVNIARLLREKFGREISIGLHGESLGAASSILALGLDECFEFCVADCPFTDLSVLLEDLGWSWFHIPKPLSHLASIASQIVHGYRLDRIRPIDSFKKNTTTAVCFIHGADDKFILPKHSKAGYEACQQYKEIHLISGAGHAESYLYARQEYHNIVSKFLEAIY
ncbi:hypothetical protein SAMN05421493_11018 [Pseudobutyrivibrio sp. 49]|uniref:alpha/beta hydrolase n=1 Tax=unclassified Pseudobutyrivibrio TaxID=2638619 RepID=UPI0008849FCD|nr:MULTISPECIES: alpha/beta hydrolase [unclassified Pseudobutyrivibrio]SDI22548.1 hypothetical protein SAMN05421493_11018 [Pseudobutyrivibrio sp. 49]SFO14626.1 hypothetical protein SAMN04487831_109108 [Pseudobutyrivibrio sp. UC1225]